MDWLTDSVIWSIAFTNVIFILVAVLSQFLKRDRFISNNIGIYCTAFFWLVMITTEKMVIEQFSQLGYVNLMQLFYFALAFLHLLMLWVIVKAHRYYHVDIELLSKVLIWANLGHILNIVIAYFIGVVINSGVYEAAYTLLSLGLNGFMTLACIISVFLGRTLTDKYLEIAG